MAAEASAAQREFHRPAGAPIDYTRLVLGTLAGFLLFSEVPGAWTLVGAGIVVASTLYITWREQALRD